MSEEEAEGAAGPDRTEVRILKNLKETELELGIVLAEKDFNIEDLTSLSPGSVLILDTLVSEPAYLAVNGKKFLAGKVVKAGENYGLEITEVLPST